MGDPCACFWTQSLISFLRQSQAFCSDIECLTPDRLPGPPAQPENQFMMIILAVLFAILLYAFRPTSLRDNKDRDDHGTPPTPPSTTN